MLLLVEPWGMRLQWEHPFLRWKGYAPGLHVPWIICLTHLYNINFMSSVILQFLCVFIFQINGKFAFFFTVKTD